jgi:hypothetical protein
MMKNHFNLTLIALLMTLLMAPVLVLSKENCKALSNVINNTALKDSPIEKSGSYCLTGDAVVPSMGSYNPRGATMLSLYSSNIKIDLQGHILSAQIYSLPVIRGYVSSDSDVLSELKISNGVLISRYSTGVLFPSSIIDGHGWFASDVLGFVDRKNRENDEGYIEIAHKDLDGRLNALVKIRNNFPLSNHLIENVKISADNIGIGIIGGGNIIRNSVIMIGDNDVNWWPRSPKSVNESGEAWGGGTASIYLFGPNQLIENNIIIFKGKTRTSRSSAAPIKIHAADGTIIRNNTIIIESSGEDVPQTAISIFDSKNVVIENNKIFGTKSVYKIWDEEDKGSSVKETGTTFPPFWKKPHPKF